MQRSYEISVRYAHKLNLDEDRIERILETVGGERVASGAGMGMRDIAFAVPRAFSAQELREIQGQIAYDQLGYVIVFCEEWSHTEDGELDESINTVSSED